MIAIAAPAPTPATAPETFVAVANRRRRRPGTIFESEREALAQLLSIARNARFDIDRMRSGRSAPLSPEYPLEVGMRVLEVVDTHRSIQSRDWDLLIDRIAASPITPE